MRTPKRFITAKTYLICVSYFLQYTIRVAYDFPPALCALVGNFNIRVLSGRPSSCDLVMCVLCTGVKTDVSGGVFICLFVNLSFCVCVLFVESRPDVCDVFACPFVNVLYVSLCFVY